MHGRASPYLGSSLGADCGLPLVRLKFLDGDEKRLLAYLCRADTLPLSVCSVPT
jgi:hypothetical protein